MTVWILDCNLSCLFNFLNAKYGETNLKVQFNEVTIFLDAELLLNLKGISVSIGGTIIDMVFFKPRSMHSEESNKVTESNYWI